MLLPICFSDHDVVLPTQDDMSIQSSMVLYTQDDMSVQSSPSSPGYGPAYGEHSAVDLMEDNDSSESEEDMQYNELIGCYNEDVRDNDIMSPVSLKSSRCRLKCIPFKIMSGFSKF